MTRQIHGHHRCTAEAGRSTGFPDRRARLASSKSKSKRTATNRFKVIAGTLAHRVRKFENEPFVGRESVWDIQDSVICSAGRLRAAISEYRLRREGGPRSGTRHFDSGSALTPSKNKGKKSYQPILKFVAETREYVSGELRNGDRPTGGQIARHLESVFAALPPQVKTIQARADSGFYCGEAVEACQNRGVQFIVSARKTSRLVDELKAAEWKRSPRTDADLEHRQTNQRPSLAVSVSSSGVVYNVLNVNFQDN